MKELVVAGTGFCASFIVASGQNYIKTLNLKVLDRNNTDGAL